MGEVELPEWCIEAMRGVYDGAWVIDPGVGNILLLVQFKQPELIDIFDAPEEIIEKHHAIFGAVLTEQGREYVDAL